jgi:hypothetical protein
MELINSPNNNNYRDIHRISAEHLKHSHPNVTNIISLMLTSIVQDLQLPNHMRHGLTTPVFKQKKSHRLPDNYRRITVISMIGKLLEKILVAPTKKILRSQVSGLQRGFCDNCSHHYRGSC